MNCWDKHIEYTVYLNISYNVLNLKALLHENVQGHCSNVQVLQIFSEKYPNFSEARDKFNLMSQVIQKLCYLLQEKNGSL